MRYAIILALLCLPILNGCTTEPKVVTETKIMPTVQPAEIVKPCPKKLARSLNTTKDVFDRMEHAERSLDVCAARVDANRAWREKTLANFPDAVPAN